MMSKLLILEDWVLGKLGKNLQRDFHVTKVFA